MSHIYILDCFPIIRSTMGSILFDSSLQISTELHNNLNLKPIDSIILDGVCSTTPHFQLIFCWTSNDKEEKEDKICCTVPFLNSNMFHFVKSPLPILHDYNATIPNTFITPSAISTHYCALCVDNVVYIFYRND